MSGYNRDQWEALLMLQHYLEGLPAPEIARLRANVGPYLEFRFDDLEELFLQAGLKSSLMYCHLSPGLLRVKAQSRRKG
jgi:hypothetical protein